MKAPQRLMSLLLCLMMVLTLVPTTVFAYSGSGTEADPYLVTTYAELKDLMANAPTDGSTRFIKLGADLSSTNNTDNNILKLTDPVAKVDLDLAGHRITRKEITSDRYVFSCEAGHLTIRDSTGSGKVVGNILNSNGGWKAVLHISGDGCLTIEGGIFESEAGAAILAGGGTTVINYGTFRCNVARSIAMLCTDGKVTVNGGDFHSMDTGISISKSADVTINACTISKQFYASLIEISGNKRMGSYIGKYSKVVDAEGNDLPYDRLGLSLETYCRVIGPVKNVAIKGIVEPVAGETPSNIVSTETVLQHCSIDKYFAGEHQGENIIEWLDGNTMNPVATFEAGKAYMVTVRLKADEGYIFVPSGDTYDTRTINGDPAFIWKVQENGKYAYIASVFICEAAAVENTVKKVDIAVADNFTDCMSAGPNVTVTGNNFSSDTSGLWHTWDDKDLSSTNKSIAGVRYYKTITLTATGGYTFNNTTAVNVSGGQLNYTAISEDGKTMTVSVKATAGEHEHTYGVTMNFNNSTHWWECSICGEKKSEAAHSLNNTTTGSAPAPGTEVTFRCTCGYNETHTMPGTSVGEFYAVAVRPRVNMALTENSVYLKDWWAEVVEIVPGSIKWYKNDETTPLNVGYMFQSGENYKVTVQFKAKSGYSFRDSMAGDVPDNVSGAGINILSTNGYKTVVESGNTLVTATGYYKGTSVGVAHTVSVALPTFTPGDKFSDYNYNSIFTVDGAASSIKTVSVVFNDATTMVQYKDGAWKVYTNSGSGWETYSGAKTLDELLTIQKDVEYEVYFRDQTSSGHFDAAKSLEVTSSGNSMTHESYFYSGSTEAAAAKATYYFENDDQIDSVVLTVTAPVLGETPTTTATIPAGAPYTAGTPTWTPGDAAFEAKSYTVSIPLTANTGKSFAAGCVFTVNGFAATYADGKVSYIFPPLTASHTHSYGEWISLNEYNHYRLCTEGDDMQVEEHVFSAWTKVDDTNHSRTCSKCKKAGEATNYTETAAHNWAWVVDTPATPNAVGKKHEECGDCGAKRNENTEIPTLTSIKVENLTVAKPVKDAAATAAGTTDTAYYVAATEWMAADGTPLAVGGKFQSGTVYTVKITLETAGDGVFSAKTTYNKIEGKTATVSPAFTDDNYADSVVLTYTFDATEGTYIPPTEYVITVTDGKAIIGAGTEIGKAAAGTTVTLTANAAPAGKVFDKWVIESGSITLADANSATTTFTIPASAVSVKATYKDAPAATYNLTTQVNGGHGTISAGKTGLTAGLTETVIFTPDAGYEIDTVTVNGVETGVLSNVLNVTMDADKTVIVTYKATGGGGHTHSYGSEWKSDADNHWHECSCGDKADKAAHDFKWVVDKEATTTQKGSKHEECKVCGYKKAAVVIPATGSTTKPTDPSNPTDPGQNPDSPETGDNSNLFLWAALLFVSGCGIFGATVYSKKKKENAE